MYKIVAVLSNAKKELLKGHYEICEGAPIEPERIYATIQQPLYEMANSTSVFYHTLHETAAPDGSTHDYDNATIYEDPTSPSYVVRVTSINYNVTSRSIDSLIVVFHHLHIHVNIQFIFSFPKQSEVYSSGSVFDEAGTYVPTMVS